MNALQCFVTEASKGKSLVVTAALKAHQLTNAPCAAATAMQLPL
jgi:hypothetical protein